MNFFKFSQKWMRILVFVFILVVTLSIFYYATGYRTTSYLHHDNYQLAYSNRVLVSTAIVNRIFPFWDHWTHTGVPLNTLYSAVPFSPIVNFVSLFGIYSKSSFTAEILITVILGFVGMYLWLRLISTHLVAGFGACSYCLSTYMILQAPISVEGIVGPSMYPLLAYGLKIAFRKDLLGVVFITIALWIMFTTGYLGTNVIAFQFLSFYCLLEFLVSISEFENQGFAWAKRLFYPVLGGISAIFILAFPIWETFTYLKFDFSQLRVGSFYPFEASTAFESIGTFLFPNRLFAFVGNQFSGHYAFLYFGTMGFFFLIYSLVNPCQLKNKALLLVFIVLTFSSTLSENWMLARVLTEAIPFYNKVRFHSWNVILTVFFAITLASLGFEDFLGTYFTLENKKIEKKIRPNKNSKKLVLAFIVLIIFGIGAHYGIRQHPGYGEFKPIRTYPQVFILILFLLVLIQLHLGNLKSLTLFFVGIFVLFFSEQIMVSKEYLQLTYGEHPDYAQNEKIKSLNFKTPENIRSGDGGKSNTQLFNKEPKINSYNPFALPAFLRIAKKREEEKWLKYIFYLESKEGPKQPLAMQITEFSPSKVKATVFSKNKNERIIWSTPYSENWRLKINHEPVELKGSEQGLFSFEIGQGSSNIELSYSPKYHWICVFLGVFSLSFLLFIMIRGRFSKTHERLWKISELE